MRALIVIAILGAWACGGAAAPRPAPAPPVPVANEIQGCPDAAAGLERATRGIRRPEESVLSPMRRRCTDDGWPARAIACFATMSPDDLGACATLLPEDGRERMFAVLAGTQQDRASVAVLVARLSALKVGVHTCDRFVAAVSTMLSCERLPLEARVQLGTETADFWSLPTSGLSAEAQAAGRRRVRRVPPGAAAAGGRRRLHALTDWANLRGSGRR